MQTLNNHTNLSFKKNIYIMLTTGWKSNASIKHYTFNIEHMGGISQGVHSMKDMSIFFLFLALFSSI